MTSSAPREASALARLTFEELGRAAGGIGGMHRAIADRAFGPTASAGHPVKLIHDAIAGGVYSALRGGARLSGIAADAALSGSQAAELSTRPRGAAVIAAINGIIGDVLERDGNDLAIEMSIRVAGRAVAPEPEALRRAFPNANGRVVVFLHGLMETERAWRLGGRQTYGELLTRDIGASTVEVRYNTGRSIAANGRSLADLLTALDAAWPARIHELALVGHSMGGLVGRSACHHGVEDGAPWVRKLRHVVSLGTPYAGAPLEQAVESAARTLERVPETRMFSSFLRRRSEGIRDLRRGLDQPEIEGPLHAYVSAEVGPLVGDGLVLRASACPADAEHTLHLDGVGHISLLNHPEVYAQMRDWLDL